MLSSKLEKLSAADIAVQMSSEFMTEVKTDALAQGDDMSDRREHAFFKGTYRRLAEIEEVRKRS
jgi:hypothetical protein